MLFFATLPRTVNSTKYPPGVLSANVFSFFNAVSFQITLGSPMILFARSLGATATILGLIAAITPLLTIFQIPAAHYLSIVGYKRMILLGWGMRTILIFLIALIPFSEFLGATTQIAILLAILFVFNLLRGISSGAWLPWITELVPEEKRSHFLSRDQLFLQTGSLFALLVAAFVLYGDPRPWQFSLAFFISALGGTMSLIFLRKIPDVSSPETLQRSGQAVPWRAMLGYKPFLHLLLFNILVMFTIGGLGAFTVAYLKTAGFGETQILFLISLNFAAALIMHRALRAALERFGSSCVTIMGFALFLLMITAWWTLAAGLLPIGIVIVGAIQFFTGIASMSFNVSNSKNMMSIMPVMGRNHFFALFAVFTSLSLGFAPVLWGLLIDRIGAFSTESFGVVWNSYSIYFSIAGLLGIITLMLSRLLPPNAASRETLPETVLQARLKKFARYWQR